MQIISFKGNAPVNNTPVKANQPKPKGLDHINLASQIQGLKPLTADTFTRKPAK